MRLVRASKSHGAGEVARRQKSPEMQSRMSGMVRGKGEEESAENPTLPGVSATVSLITVVSPPDFEPRFPFPQDRAES